MPHEAQRYRDLYRYPHDGTGDDITAPTRPAFHRTHTYPDRIRDTATLRARATALTLWGAGLSSTLLFDQGVIGEVAIGFVWTVVVGALYRPIRLAFIGQAAADIIDYWNAQKWIDASHTRLGETVIWAWHHRGKEKYLNLPADNPESPAWLVYAANMPAQELADLITGHRHTKAVKEAIAADEALTAYQQHLTGGAAALMNPDVWLREEARLRARLTGGQP